ncbi:MAG: helix-turn-helix domain-containing protein [Puia sp.]
MTEVRISHTCNMLMQENENISQISYSSGFENLSDFYRHFRETNGGYTKGLQKKISESLMTGLRLDYSSGV